MEYTEIFKKLNEIYEENPFSLALHTTYKANAESICQEGLEERAGRPIEGTIKIFGDCKKEATGKDLEWFFPYTDSTVIVGIPAIWEASRGGDSRGGSEHTCQFSIFCDTVRGKTHHKAFDGFSKNGNKLIPPELIIGYYDKSGKMTINESCAFLQKDSPYLKLLEEGWKDKRTHAQYNFYKDIVCSDHSM